MKFSLLKQKNFSLLMMGKLVSLLGNQLQEFTLSLYVLKITGSNLKFASVLAISLIPQCIFGTISGVLVDWFDRKKLIVYLDILSGVIVSIYIYIYMINGKLLLSQIYILVILLSLISAMFNPSISTIIPSIIKKEDLIAANSIDAFIKNIAILLAPMLGGILFGIFGIFIILIINAVSFILSAITEIFINIPSTNTHPEKINIEKFYNDFLDGIKFIKSKKLLLNIIVLGVITNFIFCPIFSVGITCILKQILQVSDYEFGLLTSILIIPMIIAPFIASIVSKKISLGKILFLDTLITSILIAIMSIIPSPFYLQLFNNNFIPSISLIIIGSLIVLITSIGNIALSTIFQQEVPLYLMGRVNAIMNTALMAAVPLGQLLLGILLDKISVWICISISSLILFITIMTFKKTLLYNKQNYNPSSTYNKDDLQI